MSKPTSAAAEISLIPALRDNYIFLIQQGNEAIAIDPAEASPLLEGLYSQNLTLTHILNTHHHFDHVGGNKKVKSATHCTVIGPDDPRIPALDTPVHEGERFTIGSLSFQVLFIPGHTSSHIAYFVPEKNWLFSGDTLFLGGCGRIFEGTAEQMLASLQKLAELPKETQVFCGHEYTLKNLQFAAMVEPNNMEVLIRLKKVSALCQQGEATLPATLQEELKTNPFLRVTKPELRKALDMEKASDLEVFIQLRKMKDRF
ncbi:MAG: hydroxyacylglutathione hydrolase [Chlamydiales bacterium]